LGRTDASSFPSTPTTRKTEICFVVVVDVAHVEKIVSRMLLPLVA
jgi:hypothetical protein